MEHGKMTEREYVPFAAEVQVADFEKSIKYYSDVLGFELIRKEDNLRFASFKFGKSIFMVKEVKDLPSPRGVGVVLRFIVSQDIEEYYEKVLGKGAIPYKSLEAMPYGLKRFYIKDPDGYWLKFATG